MGPRPLLDFFRRGEVARDVRLLTAHGVIAPRGEEQLAILIVLLGDADPEIREAADRTVNRIPLQTLREFLARPDVPVDCRDFLTERGVQPAEGEIPQEDADKPMIEAETAGAADESEDEQDDEPTREGLVQKLAAMTFPQRLRAAMKGNRETRSMLIRDPNKMIAAAVLSSPKVTHQEVESFARMGNVSEDVLRTIASNRSWMKNYGVLSGLARNPKTPIALSLNLLSRLNDRDAQMLSMDRNVPGPLRIAARKRMMDSVSRK